MLRFRRCRFSLFADADAADFAVAEFSPSAAPLRCRFIFADFSPLLRRFAAALLRYCFADALPSMPCYATPLIFSPLPALACYVAADKFFAPPAPCVAARHCWFRRLPFTRYAAVTAADAFRRCRLLLMNSPLIDIFATIVAMHIPPALHSQHATPCRHTPLDTPSLLPCCHAFMPHVAAATFASCRCDAPRGYATQRFTPIHCCFDMLMPLRLRRCQRCYAMFTLRAIIRNAIMPPPYMRCHYAAYFSILSPLPIRLRDILHRYFATHILTIPAHTITPDARRIYDNASRWHT